MIFLYKAKDKQGVARNGEIESTDERIAAAVLRKSGLIVTEVKPKATGMQNSLDKYFNRVKFEEVVNLTRELATMIGAGLVLSEALDILVEQQESKKLKTALEEISHDLKSGLPLATAFAKHGDIFPSVYINLVKSGEQSGKLDQVLLRLADNLEKEREFRAKVKGALIYPIVVITMMIVVVFIMMIFVIPKLTGLYKDSSMELPLTTKVLIKSSDFFVNYWWSIIISFAIFSFLFRRWKATPDGALAFDGILLKTPIVGKLIRSVTLTNFNRTFGLLMSAGIPLLEAISIVQDLTENNVFRNALRSCYIGVERGLTFSAQLIINPVFPKLIGQMVRVGEETGKVDEIFYKMADYYESEADNLVKNLTVAIEPIILIILGLGVAFLVISIILPIYQITTSF